LWHSCALYFNVAGKHLYNPLCWSPANKRQLNSFKLIGSLSNVRFHAVIKFGCCSVDKCKRFGALFQIVVGEIAGGCELRVTSYELRVAGCGLRDAGCELRDTCQGLQDASCGIRVTKIQVAGCEFRVAAYRMQGKGYVLKVASYKLQTRSTIVPIRDSYRDYRGSVACSKRENHSLHVII